MEGMNFSSTRRVPATLLAAVAAATLLGACTNQHPASSITPTGTPPVSSSPQRLQSPQPIDPAADPVVQVVDRVEPAVVNVTTRTPSSQGILGSGPGRAVGTGFIVRSDGIIVTNFHVVEGALSIKVTLPPPDKRSFSAHLIGGESEHDLAVLKVDAKDLPVVALGDSNKLLLGERVIALGYALALPGGPTVTTGVISSRARTVQVQDHNGPTRTYEDALQTDAAINPGNSGGPLVDLAGNVIGINTAGASAAENVGFAIAMSAAKPIIDEAIAHPKAEVAYMGVSTQAVDPGLAAQFGLAVDHGALVVQISPGGPTSKTNIEVGDVIVGFDGKAIDVPDQLGEAIRARKPGDRVKVDLVGQNGDRFSVTVTLGVRPLPQ